MSGRLFFCSFAVIFSGSQFIFYKRGKFYMAIKKKSPSGQLKEAASGTAKRIWGKLFRNTFLTVILVAAGGVLFNLDRLGNTGFTLLRYKHLLPSFVIRLLPGSGTPEGQALPGEILEGVALEAYDGDTLTMLAIQQQQEKKFKIRFFGIDAPEADQTYGTKSRDALRKKVVGRKIRAEVISVDRYGRCVAKVYCDGEYINLNMVSTGNAWYYPDYAEHEYDLEKAEKTARSSRIGLWQEHSPQQPWMYRKENRK